MDKYFYLKFPSVFKMALQSGKVSFEEEVEVNYDEFEAFRGIFRREGESFSPLSRDDFKSQAEQGKKPSARNGGNSSSFYSCSVYTDYKDIEVALNFPKQDRKIAKGVISQDNGCIYKSKDVSHVDWWLYEETSEFWKDYSII